MTARRRHPARALRNYLIAGLLIWIPIMVTVWVVRFLSGILDQSLVLLPPPWRPEALFGHYIPGFGIVLSLLLLLVTGVAGRVTCSAGRSSKASRAWCDAFR